MAVATAGRHTGGDFCMNPDRKVEMGAARPAPRGTPEIPNQHTGITRFTGTLPPAECRVKRSVYEFGPLIAPIFRSDRPVPPPPFHDHVLGAGEVVKKETGGPLAGPVARQATGWVGWPSEARGVTWQWLRRFATGDKI